MSFRCVKIALSRHFCHDDTSISVMMTRYYSCHDVMTSFVIFSSLVICSWLSPSVFFPLLPPPLSLELSRKFLAVVRPIFNDERIITHRS